MKKNKMKFILLLICCGVFTASDLRAQTERYLPIAIITENEKKQPPRDNTMVMNKLEEDRIRRGLSSEDQQQLKSQLEDLRDIGSKADKILFKLDEMIEKFEPFFDRVANFSFKQFKEDTANWFKKIWNKFFGKKKKKSHLINIEPPDIEKPVNFDHLKLSGIVVSEGRSRAIINKRLYSTGDMVHGARLINIQDGYVVLESNETEIILRIKRN